MFVDVTAIRVALRNERTPESHRGEKEKEQVMTIRKAIALAGLVLTVAILNPASALANPVTTDCPIRASGSGTVTLNVLTVSYTSDATQVSTCIGKSTVHLDGTGAFTGPDTFVGSGPFTLTAANGDELTGTHMLTATGFTPGSAHTTTVVATITGGTGQFAEASGTVTSTAQVTSSSFNGVTLVSTVEYTATGQISF
jgi:hypothetical protein